MIKVELPLTKEVVKTLHAGDELRLYGNLLTARDAAHAKLVNLMQEKEALPVSLENQVIYYTGPTPTRPGQLTGSAGPTTAGRMDAYSIAMMQAGITGMIGKGRRSQVVKEAMVAYGVVYMTAIGGGGAYLAQRIKSSEILAYPELGPEAIRQLYVADFPVFVVNDVYGQDLYETGQQQYEKK